MSADLLRRAAQQMRERAEKVRADDPVVDWYTADHRFAGWAGAADAEHIASWHPAVALAVADLLDQAPCSCVPCPCCDVVVACGDCDTRLAALAVARAYLGEDG